MKRADVFHLHPLVDRATRYPLQLAMRYRAETDGPWQDATTGNISASGVLFETRRLGSWIESNAPIEMQLQMPLAAVEGPGAWVVCTGSVRRIADAGPGTRVAATIERYWLTSDADRGEPPDDKSS